jgi:hypothetical protein
MKYDFDIQPVAVRARFRDPNLNRLLCAGGASDEVYVALFRDGRTAGAIAGASPKVKALFLASGFGFSTADSGAPEGCYPREHEAERREVLDNLSCYDLTGEDANAFSFSAFVAHAQSARPVEVAHAASGQLKTDVGNGWRSSRDPEAVPAALASELRGQRLSGLSVPPASPPEPQAPTTEPAWGLIHRAASAIVVCLALWGAAVLFGLTGPVPSDDLDPSVQQSGLGGRE